MTWNPETTYTAKIGGLTYRNVTQPIVYGDQSLISFARDSESGRLGASFDLVRQDRAPIASVINSEVTLHNPIDYAVVSGSNRIAVIETSSGRVWCEIREPPRQAEYELEISCILVTDSGYPIFLHPDRSKFGTANDDQPPNIASSTITASEAGSGTGLEIIGSGYLLDVGFENHHTGVSVRATGADDDASP